MGIYFWGVCYEVLIFIYFCRGLVFVERVFIFLVNKGEKGVKCGGIVCSFRGSKCIISLKIVWVI